MGRKVALAIPGPYIVFPGSVEHPNHERNYWPGGEDGWVSERCSMCDWFRWTAIYKEKAS